MPTFYRIVQSNPPTRADFVSDRERGRPQPRSTEFLRLWDDFSVMASVEAAQAGALAFPSLGSFIATVNVPDEGSVRYEHPTKRPGRHTIWGNPDVLLRTPMCCLDW